VQAELSSSQNAAEDGEARKAELRSLTEKLEEQRKLTSQAEQALATSKVRRAMLCYAMLRYAALRCAGLCCAVLCCAVLCCAVLCCAVLCCAVLCCAVLCCATLRAAIQLCVQIPQHIYQASLLCAVTNIVCGRMPCMKSKSKSTTYLCWTDLVTLILCPLDLSSALLVVTIHCVLHV